MNNWTNSNVTRKKTKFTKGQFVSKYFLEKYFLNCSMVGAIEIMINDKFSFCNTHFLRKKNSFGIEQKFTFSIHV